MEFRALFIETEAKRVTVIQTEGTLDDLYRLLMCNQVEGTTLSASEVLYSDEEALLADEPGPFFTMKGLPHPIGGRGLIIGIDGEGEHVSSKLMIAELGIEFPDLKFVGFEPIRSTTKVGGRTIKMVGHRPVFKKKNGKG